MSSLQTAFQTTRGARTANWELALVSTCPRWRARRVPLSGTFSSVPVVQSPVPAGKRETCRRRRARAATPKSAFSTWPRPPCSRRASRPRHRSCDGLAVLAESANRADCQRDACRIYSRTALAQAVVTLVVVPPRAAWTQCRPRAFWIPWRGMLELCRGLIGHIGPTKTSELKTTSSAPGSCRYQPRNTSA